MYAQASKEGTCWYGHFQECFYGWKKYAAMPNQKVMQMLSLVALIGPIEKLDKATNSFQSGKIYKQFQDDLKKLEVANADETLLQDIDGFPENIFLSDLMGSDDLRIHFACADFTEIKMQARKVQVPPPGYQQPGTALALH